MDTQNIYADWTQDSKHLRAEVARLRNEAKREGAILAEVTGQRDGARAEVERLREALADIAEDTDADNPLSYRRNDREGCLDWVYAKATAALTTR